jgi:hypothetical protein
MRYFVALVLIMGLWACQSDHAASEKCVRVKYLRGICGQGVLQLLSPTDFDLGETVGGEVNVFLGLFECGVLEPAVDSVFFVELKPQEFDGNCARCLAAVDFSGTKQYNVRIVKNCAGAE